MESLAQVVRDNPKIPGVRFEEFEKKIGLIADDTLLITEASVPTIQEVENVLDWFERTSGLKINYNKSVICSIGRKKINFSMYLHNDFTWLQPEGKLKYLGFIATAEGSLTPWGNFDLIQKQLSNTLSKLRYQKRSLIGKVRTIKTMLTSLFIYRLSLLLNYWID